MMNPEKLIADCKIDGCKERTHVIKGAYAYLCTTHRKERAFRTPRKPRSLRSYSAPQLDLKGAVSRLGEIAERIEDTSRIHIETKNTLIQDVTHFNDILEEIKNQLKSLINPNGN